MKKEMLINVLQPEECRIAIVEDGVLEELYVERTSHESYVGNIYKGRIVNIEPSIQAAFVDFGVGRNGFLHVSDVEPAYYRHLEQRGGDNGGRRDRGRDRHRRPPQPALDDYEDFEPLSPEPPAGPAGIEAVPGTDEPTSAPTGPEPERASEAAPDQRGGRGRRRSRGRSRRSRDDDRTANAGRREESPEEPVEAKGPAEESPAEAIQESERRAPESDRCSEAEPEARAGGAEERPPLMGSAEHRTEEGEPEHEPLEPPPGFDEDANFLRQPERELAPMGESPAATATEEDEPAGHREPAYEPQRQRTDDEADNDLDDESQAEVMAEERLPEFADEESPERSRRPRRREDRRGDDRRGRRGGGRRMGGGRPGMGRPKPLIQDIFRRGQEVLVQVIKEGIGTKGPTLSTYISIAGRYLVLMPGLNRIGVSRKIADDDQRRRLREILNELQPPRGLGFIIRTAGLDKNKKELQRDLAYLSRLWQVVVRRIKKIKAPAEIYQESDMITRTIRDTFTSEIDTIWVDEPAAFEHAQEFLQIVMPRYANRIKCYSDTEPMFHKYGIEDEIARIQQRHVPLPNGGSIVIDQTEALVAIDVNSGNFRADNNAEETAYQMNLLAAKEIARQLRLRDLGGVIVNDFIDMRDEKHRRGVEKALRDAVKRDRARTKILKISAFGLIEMTRQRIRPSLKRSVYQDCSHCRGTGQVKTCESMSIDVMRMLQLAAHQESVLRIQVRVADDVAHYLLNRKRKEITRLEEEGGIQVNVTGVTGVAPETLEFVCYDRNNNEVKFLPYEDNRPRRR
jgi:ribonuclease E